MANVGDQTFAFRQAQFYGRACRSNAKYAYAFHMTFLLVFHDLSARTTSPRHSDRIAHPLAMTSSADVRADVKYSVNFTNKFTSFLYRFFVSCTYPVPTYTYPVPTWCYPNVIVTALPLPGTALEPADT